MAMRVESSLSSLYLPELAQIVRTEQFTEKEKFLEVRFKNGKELGHTPGQFVQVSVYGIGEAPLSISSSPTKKGSFDLCVRAVGSVTNALHRLGPGSLLGIRGPFGRGFPLDILRGKDLVFMAGGIGLIPLRSLINYVLDNRADFGKITILYGAKYPKEFLFNEERATWAKRKDIECMVTVDRPDETWTGHVGVITTLCPKLKMDPKNTYALIVGPPVMYKFAIQEMLMRAIPPERIIVSLERRMKCGVGKCGHCQINGFYVCQEGPVFTYAEIMNIKEAI